MRNQKKKLQKFIKLTFFFIIWIIFDQLNCDSASATTATKTNHPIALYCCIFQRALVCVLNTDRIRCTEIDSFFFKWKYIKSNMQTLYEAMEHFNFLLRTEQKESNATTCTFRHYFLGILNFILKFNYFTGKKAHMQSLVGDEHWKNRSKFIWCMCFYLSLTSSLPRSLSLAFSVCSKNKTMFRRRFFSHQCMWVWVQMRRQMDRFNIRPILRTR